MCDCISLFNEQAERKFNTRVNSSLALFPGQVPQVYLEVVKADDKKRGKPMNVLAAYCPFCGEKYPEATK